MKKIIALALAATLSVGTLMAQQPELRRDQPAEQQSRKHGDCSNCPHHNKHHGDQKGRHGKQHHAQRSTELQYNADGLELTLVRAFPGAKSVNKTDKWTEVYDAKKTLLGYAVYSKPASDGIKGYAGETPVLIALDKKKVITGVFLLPNLEGPRFVKSVEDAGFFNHWNGLTVKKALKKEVDAVSGATMTSTSVAKSVQAALSKL